ncbi:hypothetical protein [Ruegeria meonggei]|uniref:Uncharacterized protein n=1 Tax=Ruegeria meonggei TaxID=1446476 RepID=A0A1X6YS59_9RHOB|nr:hypothetical protein [Ruegeria meonggei]SLN29528.1 hypothetical protein RUM8411_01192 [Ruegeria meonggei]
MAVPNEAQHQRNFEEFQMINEKAIDTSNIVLKSALLINGGAAVAVLGFVASIVKDNGDLTALLEGVAFALMYFAWGVAASVIALALAYLTHYSMLAILNKRTEGKSDRLSRIANVSSHVLAFLATVSAIGLFVLGAYQVKATISSDALASSLME